MSAALESDKAVKSGSSDQAAKVVPSRRVSARQLSGLASPARPNAAAISPPNKTAGGGAKKTEESGVYAKRANGVGKRASVAPPPPARPLSSIPAKRTAKPSPSVKKASATLPPPVPAGLRNTGKRPSAAPLARTSVAKRPAPVKTLGPRSVRREEPSYEEIDVNALMPVAMPRPVTSLAQALKKTHRSASVPPPPPAIATRKSVPPSVAPSALVSAVPVAAPVAVPAAPPAQAAPAETGPVVQTSEAPAQSKKKRRDWSIEFLLAPSPFHRDDRANLERFARFRLPTADDVKRVAGRLVALVRRDGDAE